MARTVLVVDDDPTQLRLLESVVTKAGFRVEKADGGATAIALLTGEQRASVDVVLLDLVMPEVDGLEVLEQVRPQRPELPIVVLTAHGGVDTVVKAMRAGASDFMVKPAAPERIRVTLENSLKLSTLTGEISRLHRRMSGEMTFDDLVGNSAAMQAALHLAQRGASSNIPILIEGESGVGKEMVARAIQGTSERAGRPFVTVNCGAIPDNLVESILFGHEKGSFTGASAKSIGKFQEASTGTLFLDEIGELKLDMQVKLLRALQQGEIDPVGASRPVKVDIRLISATNRTLSQMVSEGTFREDLYYRLNVFPITLPPLRDRPEDVPDLINHFTRTFAASENKNIQGVTAEAMAHLCDHDWPGNVRQLENAVFRAVVLAEDTMLTPQDFPQITGKQPMPDGQAPMETGDGVSTGKPILNLHDNDGHVRPLEQIESDVIRHALKHYDGQMSEIARRLKIGRSTLYRKIGELEEEDAAD